MFPFLSSYRDRLTAFVRKQAEPSPKITSAPDRRTARNLALTTMGLLMAILLPLVVTVTFLVKIPLLIEWSVYGTTAMIFVAYLLSRTPYYWVGVRLMLLTFSLAPVAIIMVTPNVSPALYVLLAGWNMAALIMGALFLPRPPFLLLLLVNIGLMAIPAATGKVTWSDYAHTASVIVLLSAILFGIAGASRRYAEEMAASEQRFRSLFEGTPEALLIFTSKKILDINPAFERLFGYTADEIIGTPPLELVAPENREHLVEEFSQAMTSPDHIVFVQGLRKDGSRFPAGIALSALHLGGQEAFAASIRDRSRYAQAEAERRKLARAIEQSAHSVVITDRTAAIEYVNPAFTRVTGYTFEEAIGQNPRILKSDKHPRAFYQQLWNTILKGNVWHGEFINRRKDGTLYWERASIAPVTDEEGRITHFVAVKEDITAYKEMEAALRRAHDEAQQANRLKTRLLANVGHDMRTPLGGILGYTEMLLDGSLGEISPSQRHALERILQSTQQLIEFTTDLLNQAELESGRIRFNISEFSPKDLLKVVSSSQSMAKAKGLQVHIEVDPALPKQISGDPYWLRQIIANLLSNAIKFTAEGDIWLRLRRVDEEHWAIEVEDTGEGIPPEAQKHIFEAFRQADGSPTRRHKGTGLGLSIVQQLVDLMHGEIKLESTPGKGSTFTVILPCQAHLSEDSHDGPNTP